MDDPWGSPWADELHQSTPAPATKETNGLTLTPILPGKGAVATETTDIAWDASGDGFGSWPSPPLVQDLTKDGSTSSALPTWETPGAGDIKKIDVGGLSPHWDASQPASGHSTPKLSPTILSKPAEVPRQPSPDPWATVGQSLGADRQVIPEGPGQDEKHEVQSAEHEGLPETRGPKARGSSPAKPKEGVLPAPAESDIAAEAASDVEPQDAEKAIAISEQDNVGKDTDEASRSSSSPSDHSNHNDLHSDSPRTSLDDDTLRPEVHRHVSEKIQVLVEHYDALAKAQLEDDVIVTRAPRSDNGEAAEAKTNEDEEPASKVTPEATENEPVKTKEIKNISEIENQKGDGVETEVRNEDDTQKTVKVEDEDKEDGGEEDDEDDDFGDFEEGTSQVSQPAGDEKQGFNHPEGPVPGSDRAQTSDDPTAQEKSKPLPVPEKDFGRVEYSVDIPALANLYAGLKPEPPVEPGDKLFIPDTIPRDSFTSVEERKMWYRLSRYTTLRQHNSGDDDNTYIRVAWPESKVREETLKFAGQWMEQDRISGRVILGGSSKDGSLFGWNDPKAAPMPLATAFAMNRKRKKPQAATAAAPGSEAPKEPPKGHPESRPPSQSSSPQKQRRRSSTKAPRTSVDAKQKAQQPVASFGWSSEPQPAIPLPILNQTSTPSGPPSSHKPSSPVPHSQPVVDIFASASSTSQMPSSFSGWDEPPPPVTEPVPAKAPAPAKPPAPAISPAPTKLSVPAKAPEQAVPPVPAVSSVPAKPSAPIIQTTVDDFDDDWGEMISSPAVISPPQMPPAASPVRGLWHKKSQSLIGTSLLPSQARTNGPSLPSIPLGSGHRPTSSLDGSSTSNPFSMNMATSDAFSAAPTNAVPPLSSDFDPWASADFSVFDSPAPPPKPKSAPPAKPTIAQPHRLGAKSVTFESTRVPPLQRGNGKTREEIEQDRIVARIIRGLPDLSYMLRR